MIKVNKIALLFHRLYGDSSPFLCYDHTMKKSFIYNLILIIGLTIPLFDVSAQGITPSPAVEGVSTQNESVDLQDLTNQPLEVRRQVVSIQLKGILGKFNVLYDKTKLAMDRLSVNGIDTTKAAVELKLAAETLAKAKLNIDAFTDMDISFKPTAFQPTPLRDAVVKAETSLKESREHIINTLVLLKAAISADVQ